MFEEVREELKRQGLSINKLSFKAEIQASDLSCALNGRKPFYPNWRKRVAAALGVPEDKLFPEEQ